eukprot:CAMPEP_0170810866 /NCGR_PEP_ID=MMETSP0733-20121128/34914_1 /TAXON_ID=186038 /ORGANISM="Fragilariopsis kerguelensis, Strain L26-C5" /LENGTH=304 /DNA_ID=CAMNT_0011166907 /DNA_START=1 /DNA_END=912 /DNA_ORIENTATION=+
MKTTLTTTTEAAVRFATVSPSEGSNTSNSSNSNSKRSGGARRFRLDRGRRSSAPAISISGGDLAAIISEDNYKDDTNDKNDIFVYTGPGTTGAGVHVHVDDEQQRREEQATAKTTKADPTGGEYFLDAKEKPPRIMTDSMRELLKIDDEAFSPTVSLTSSLRTKTKTKTTQSSKPSSSTKPTHGDEDYTAHVCFGGDATTLSPRSSSAARAGGRQASRSPPPPSVSERSTSPSLPRKIRQFKNKPQLQHVNVKNNSGAGLQYKRRVSASTPNLAAMASSADLNMDRDKEDAVVKKDEAGLARVD